MTNECHFHAQGEATSAFGVVPTLSVCSLSSSQLTLAQLFPPAVADLKSTSWPQGILWDPQPISGIFNKEAMHLFRLQLSPTKHIMLYSVLPYVRITWAKWCKWSWAVIPSTSLASRWRMDNNICLISSTPLTRKQYDADTPTIKWTFPSDHPSKMVAILLVSFNFILSFMTEHSNKMFFRTMLFVSSPVEDARIPPYNPSPRSWPSDLEGWSTLHFWVWPCCTCYKPTHHSLPCHLEWQVWNRTNTTCCCCLERMPWAHFIQDCVSFSKG